MSSEDAQQELPDEVVGLLLSFLRDACGDGNASIERVPSNVAEKTAGTKILWRVTFACDGLPKCYYLKTTGRHSQRLEDLEALEAELRAATIGTTAWAITSIKHGSVAFVGGLPDQIYLLEPEMPGDLLIEAIRALRSTEGVSQLADAIARWLAGKHKPVENKPHHYVRQLFGGSFGILATIDAFPVGAVHPDVLERFAAYALRWRNRLLQREMVEIHGDFHPWNLFYDSTSDEIHATGALHTSYGAPEDDWCCLSVNLATEALEQAAAHSLDEVPSWMLLNALDTSAAKEMRSWATGFFCGWRLMILANPFHFPHRSPQIRDRLVRAALWCLQDYRRHSGSTAELLREALLSDPWVRGLPSAGMPRHESRFKRDLFLGEPAPFAVARHLAQDAGGRCSSPVCVTGRIRSIRRHGGIVFYDLQPLDPPFSADRFQITAQRSSLGDRFADLQNSLCIYDRVSIQGQPYLTEAGEPSIDIETIQWISRNALPSRVSDALVRSSDKAAIWSEVLGVVRRTMDREQFREVWTPVIENSFGGGFARPFEVLRYHNKHDCYLRVTMELLHKQLLAGGFSKLYEIGPSFRNESEDRSHMPEFLMLEAYAAGRTLCWMEDIAISVVKDAWKVTRPDPWPGVVRSTVQDAFREFLSIDLRMAAGRERLASLLGREIKNDADMTMAVRSALIHHLRSRLPGVHLIGDIPTSTTPFAVQGDGRRSWLHVCGVAVADICEEEVAPSAVLAKLQAQAGREAVPVLRDYGNFSSALYLGLPPCVGIGMSLQRLIQVLMGSDDIRGTRWWNELLSSC